MDRQRRLSAIPNVVALLVAGLGAALLAWLVLGGGWGTPALIACGSVVGLKLGTARRNRRVDRR